MNCGICGKEGATEKVSSPWVPRISYLRCEECAARKAESASLIEAVLFEMGAWNESSGWQQKTDPDLLEQVVYWREDYVPVWWYVMFPIWKRSEVRTGDILNHDQAGRAEREVERLEHLFRSGEAGPFDYLRYVVGLNAVVIWDWGVQAAQEERKRIAAAKREKRMALAASVPAPPAEQEWDDTPLPWESKTEEAVAEPDTDLMQAFKERRSRGKERSAAGGR